MMLAQAETDSPSWMDAGGSYAFDPHAHPEHLWMFWLAITLIVIGCVLWVRADAKFQALVRKHTPEPCKRCAWDKAWVKWAYSEPSAPEPEPTMPPPHTCWKRAR